MDSEWVSNIEVEGSKEVSPQTELPTEVLDKDARQPRAPEPGSELSESCLPLIELSSSLCGKLQQASTQEYGHCL